MYRTALLVVGSLLLGACATTAERKSDVTFNPKIGDEKDYWAISDMTLSGYPQRQQVKTLQHYEVTDTEPLELVVTSDYLSVDAGGYDNLDSIKSSKANEKMGRLFQSGFKISLNRQTGELLDLKGVDDKLWQEVLAKSGNKFVDMLKKNMLSPGVLTSIPAKEGAEVSIPSFADQSVLLKVFKVTNDKVFATVDAADKTQATKSYGEMVIDRQSGWLDQLLMVIEQPLDLGSNYKVTAHMHLTMLPKDQLIPFNYQGFMPMEDWYEIGYQEFSTVKSGRDILVYDKGVVLNNYNNLLTLGVPLKVSNDQFMGRIKLTDVRVYDENNKPLDIDFEQLSSISPYDGMNASSHDLQPIGWNKEKELNAVDHAVGQVNYYSTHVYSKTIDWSKDKQEFDFQGMKVEVIPDQNDPLLFTIRSFSPNNHLDLWWTAKGFNGKLKIIQVSDLPDWLQYSDKLMFEDLGHQPKRTERQIKFNSLPKQVTFFASELTDKPSFSKKMTFLSPQKYVIDPMLPPPQERPMAFVEDDDKAIHSFADIKTQIDKHQGSTLLMPAEWANVCKLEVTSGNQENGHVLQWVRQADDGYGHFKSTGTWRYQLATDDNVLHYFYGISVTSKLSCQGQPQWHELDYQPSDTPWLVSIKSLAGTHDELDLQQSVSDFVKHYQLLNYQDEPLSLLLPNGYLVEDPDNTKLADIVLPKLKVIRLAGKVFRIQKLEVQGEALSRQWTQHFPALP